MPPYIAAKIWYYRIPLIYLLTILVFGPLGYFSTVLNSNASGLQLLACELPKKQPDQIHSVDLWDEDDQYLARSSGVALVTEFQKGNSPAIRYWCASQHQRWGEVEFHFPIPTDRKISSALLQHEVVVFGLLDPLAQAEIWVDLEGDGSFQFVDRIQSNVLAKFPQVVDLTEWITGKSELRIRYRIKGGRLIFHPTPNDPVGFAGAQACRSVHGEPPVMQLNLWYSD